MTNKAFERGVALSMKTPAAVKSGDFLMFGSVYGASASENVLMYGVATEDATDAFSNVKANIGVDREGAFSLPVLGEAGSPLVLHALKAGDPIYADVNGAGSTYDATTNCWTGVKLDGNPGGTHIGWTLDAVPAGAGATTVRVVFRT